jgi:hypothetical protein
MDTNRMTTLMPAGCQAVLLWSLMPQTIPVSEAESSPEGRYRFIPFNWRSRN